MKKLLRLLYLSIICLTLTIHSHHTEWQKLSEEVKTYILSLIPSGNSMAEILQTLTTINKNTDEFWEVIKSLGLNPAEIVAALAKRYINENNDRAYKEFFNATERDQFSIVKALIKGKININAKNKRGFTALEIATYYGYKDIVKLLINSGAVINGTKALIIAVEKGYIDIVKMLVDKDADVNITGEFQKSALTLAVKYGNKHLTKILLEAGADVNAQDKLGNTALIYAAANGNKDIVEMLLDKNVNINITNNKGETALNIAVQSGHKDIAQLLIYTNK